MKHTKIEKDEMELVTEQGGLDGRQEVVVENILIEAAVELRNIWKADLDEALRQRARRGFFAKAAR